MRELPTPVILDQARVPLAPRCKVRDQEKMSVALPVGLSRNGGHESIEESEIYTMSVNAEGSTLVWGGVI